MKTSLVLAASLLVVSQPPVPPPVPVPQPVLSVASETPVYVPVDVQVLNPAVKSSALIEVPGAAYTKATGKHSLFFTGPPGTYQVSAIYVEIDKDGVPVISKLTATTKIVGPQPAPGPAPGPTPKPPDPVDPDDVPLLPFPATGFYAVLLKQDTDMNKYTPVQRAALGGQATASYLNEKSTPNGGQPSWRVFDVDQQFTGEGTWKEAHIRAKADMKSWESKNPGKKTPWLLCGNGTKGFSGPVDPESLDKTLEILKRYGG